MNRRTIAHGALTLALICTLTAVSAFAAGPPSGGGSSTTTNSHDYSSQSASLEADGTSVSSSNESYSSSTADENAALVKNSGTLSITSDSLTKSGSDTDGDNCNFYGINSILLGVGSSSHAYVANSTLTATGQGSNGIFATSGATIYANNDTISTTSSNSRGLDATYAGTIVGNELGITTQGDHCASIATDRGGGYVSCANSTLSTAGSGSPLLYSTGDIEVDNCTGTASGSQICGMEGYNDILIYNSSLTSTNDNTSGSDPIKNGVIIYQSTSGDADTSTSSSARFDASDSTLKTSITSGAFFYLTNTTANVVLSNTTLDYDSDNVSLIEAVGNSSNNWGSAGSNGATANLTCLGETVSGDAVVDTISTLKMYLLEGTTWTGATEIDTNSSATSTSSAPLSINVDATSTWVVSADSTVTNLNLASGGSIVDSSGNAVRVVNASGTTLVSGTSSITVTVTGSFSTDVSTSSANALSTSYISRTAFDSNYGTSTNFGTNGESSSVITRLYGDGALDTMEAIVDKGIADGNFATGGSVVVSTSGGYWDALAASGLAGTTSAPVVLTSATTLSSQAKAELTNLAPTTVYITGGTSAISSAVESSIKSLLPSATVTRLGGNGATDTADLICGAGSGWSTTCIIATCDSFQDALSIAPYSYWSKSPIFLTSPTTDVLSDSTLAQIKAGGFTSAVIVGGTSAVSSTVPTQLADAGLSTSSISRLWGEGAYDTAEDIAEWEIAQGMSANMLGVATGESYYDALSGASLCGSNGSLLVLAAAGHTACISGVVTDNASSITSCYIFGGPAAVPTTIYSALSTLLG